MPIVTAQEFTSTKFDYLIIGGGTAGLALASRLSESTDVIVGVVEAGDYDVSSPEINIPGMIGSGIAHPKFDWSFFSVPQTHVKNNKIMLPRGKGLGGSSLINFCALTRPNKEELDAIEQLGNPGWNWESFLYYMKKSECLLPDGPESAEDGRKYAIFPDPSFHGTEGPMVKSISKECSEKSVHTIVLDTAEALGIERNCESSNGTSTGAMSYYGSVDPRTATRSHSARAYYEPNAERKNFLVLLEAQVVKIILESGETGTQKAVGIEYVHKGQKLFANVGREVILSAGSLQTPQILELSGIGNPNILKTFNIPSLIDLPGVGENLQDHVSVLAIVDIDPKFYSADMLADPAILQKHLELYKQQQGYLSKVPSGAFVFTSMNAIIGGVGEIESWKADVDKSITETLTTVNPALRSGLIKQYQLQQNWLADSRHPQAEILTLEAHATIPSLKPISGKRYTTLLGALMHPLSRGTVHIDSSDPLTPPAIDPKFFSNKMDLNLMVKILDLTLKFYRTAPLSDIIKHFVFPSEETVLSGGEEREKLLREFILDTASTIFHPVGTAAMLPRLDGGVVDPELKVYGTSNLRVVDASILPMIPASHTQSVTYAIGEKAADIIKATW